MTDFTSVLSLFMSSYMIYAKIIPHQPFCVLCRKIIKRTVEILRCKQYILKYGQAIFQHAWND